VRLRISFVLIPLLVLAGGLAAQEVERVETAQIINGVPVRIERTDGSSARSEQLSAPADSVWKAVTDVFAELRLPGTAARPDQGVVAVANARVRRIGGRSIPAFFECGARYGNAASEYDVYVSVSTAVTPVEGSTRMRTEVSAVARASVNATTLPCSGTGLLETLIAERVRARLGGS
jgi:hypothetical protein